MYKTFIIYTSQKTKLPLESPVRNYQAKIVAESAESAYKKFKEERGLLPGHTIDRVEELFTPEFNLDQPFDNLNPGKDSHTYDY